MNSFQTIVLGIFGFFIIAGLLAIALVKQKGGPDTVSLSMWGALSDTAVEEIIRESFNAETLKLSYQEVPEESLDEELVEALAAGRGPDLILLPLELVLRYRDKLQLIPYATYGERAYKDSFIQEADLFLTPQGVLALPFSLDPLVMYFNRDFLDEAGIAAPPKYWDEFLSLARNLTDKDDLGNLSLSAVALGEYRNISHAKEILATLLMQGGNQIVVSGESGRRVTLNQSGTAAIVDFFTEFANPQKPLYSWNRSLPASKNMFLASKLAVYFGLASEYGELRKGNPNLDFDVALFPRPRNASVGLTYGKLTGVAVLRTSPSRSKALEVALTLSAPRAGALLQSRTGLAPVQRTLLSQKPTDAYGAVIYDSASRARGFLDPNPKVTAEAWRVMIESITSGKARSGEALQRAQQEMQAALR